VSYSLLHSRLESNLKARGLLSKGTRILVALSGGQDSLCLTKILLDLNKRWFWDLAVAHCDHGWASDLGMAEHVQAIVKSWGLPFYLKATNSLLEREEAARKWRYQVLEEIAQKEGFEAVVTGHTESDRAETLLYNLIRGTGTDGLAALDWQRSLTPKIKLVRPMLNITRSETGSFCREYELPVWEDAVNQKLQYARNRLRLEVIPYLVTHFNPQIERHLGQTAEILKGESEYLESIAAEISKRVIAYEPLRFNRLTLTQQEVPLALQRRVIRHFLTQSLPKMPNFEQIEAIIKLINAPNGSKTSSFPGQFFLVVEHEWIVRRTIL
jgi:tRNA(Ile)-lysidine synthase